MLEKYLPFLLEMKSKWKVNDDCMQMIYLDFLEYDNEKLNEIENKDEMKFWLTRLIMNEWFSKTSRYYYTYEKWYARTEPID